MQAILCKQTADQFINQIGKLFSCVFVENVSKQLKKMLNNITLLSFGI